MTRKKCLKICIYLIFACSILGNIVFFCSDVLFEYKIWSLERTNANVQPVASNIEQFRTELIDGCFVQLENGSKITPPHRGRFTDNLKSNLKGYGKNSAVGFFGGGYCMWGILNHAVKQHDTETVERIEKHFSKNVLDVEIQKVDQSPNGIVALMLFDITKKNEYKQYANKIYEWLKAQNTADGIPYNAKSDFKECLVDGIGMFNPFLTYYAKHENNSEAYKIALQQAELYLRHGCDAETGIPAHAYRRKAPRIKMGSINWGRGASWLALGMIGIDVNDLSDTAQVRIERFNQTMFELYKQNEGFSQFNCQDPSIDLSATLPILLYFREKNIYKPTEKELLQFSKYMHNTILYNSSGDTRWLNRYNEFYGPFAMAQGVMLLLLE